MRNELGLSPGGNCGHSATPAFVPAPLPSLVYLAADPGDIEKWFVSKSSCGAMRSFSRADIGMRVKCVHAGQNQLVVTHGMKPMP